MESDGGIDLDEVEKIFSRGGLKLQTQVIERFNELDANKNGKLEQSEVKSEGEGEDYAVPALLPLVISYIIGIGSIACVFLCLKKMLKL